MQANKAHRHSEKEHRHCEKEHRHCESVCQSRQTWQSPLLGMLMGGFLLLLFLSLSSCTPEFLTEEELTAYVLDEDNNLTKTSTSNGFDIKVTYRPTDLLIAQEAGDKELAAEELKRLQDKYGNYYYFILSISKDNKEGLYKQQGGFDQFSELVQTLSFRMATYVNMTTSGKDTIEVADFIFSRTYGMGSATSLLFVFNKEEAAGDEWLQFNVKEFGMGLGNQTFRFRKEDLDTAPKIKFKTSITNG
jgi:hypothetical protein